MGIYEVFGGIVLVDKDHNVSVTAEKPLSKRLDILFHKSLHLVALSVAESEKVRPFLSKGRRCRKLGQRTVSCLSGRFMF